jgi:large subunit ribosomal protein L16
MDPHLPGQVAHEEAGRDPHGQGQGIAPELWVAVVKPGRVLFEIEGVSKEIAQKALALASAKLGVKTKFVVREEALSDEG